MSGHDFIDWPASHESVWDTTECRGSCGQKPPCSNCADVRIPVQWTRWPIVDALRAKPARERRQGPRSSRFGGL